MRGYDRAEFSRLIEEYREPLTKDFGLMPKPSPAEL
jgi:hypothetical protein